MVVGHIAYLSVVAILGSVVSKDLLGMAPAAVVGVGLLGTWRYGWAAINFARAFWFRVVSHPRRKAAARVRFAASGHKSHAFMLVTSYMIPPETTICVYRALFKAAGSMSRSIEFTCWGERICFANAASRQQVNN